LERKAKLIEEATLFRVTLVHLRFHRSYLCMDWIKALGS
jgi:hypothetical protein